MLPPYLTTVGQTTSTGYNAAMLSHETTFLKLSKDDQAVVKKVYRNLGIEKALKVLVCLSK